VAVTAAQARPGRGTAPGNLARTFRGRFRSVPPVRGPAAGQAGEPMAPSLPRRTGENQGVSQPGREGRLRRRRHRSTILGGLPVVLLAAITRDVGDAALWRADRERQARERREAAEREQSLRCANEPDGRNRQVHHETTAADPIEARICEMAKTEWGVAYERGEITACESEQAARQLQAASGGELVYRRTWITNWSRSQAPLPAREARPRAHAATPESA